MLSPAGYVEPAGHQELPSYCSSLQLKALAAQLQPTSEQLVRSPAFAWLHCFAAMLHDGLLRRRRVQRA